MPRSAELSAIEPRLRVVAASHGRRADGACSISTRFRSAERLLAFAAALSLVLSGCPELHGLPEDAGTDVPDLDGPLPDVVELDAALDVPLPSDVPLPVDAPPSCTTNEDCQRVPWCEHRWRCDPADASADARGCVDEGGPYECPEGYECVSAARECRCIDRDGDGVLPPICGGLDCDDADPSRPGPSPSEMDGCDGFDSDCDGIVDENPDVTLFVDSDGDGHGVDGTGRRACSGDGLVRTADDCDDGSPYRYPGAREVCNRDNDVCEAEPQWLEDYDDDGFAPLGAACRDDVPGARPRLDCSDHSRLIGPGQPDTCNGLDDDCDPSTPDGTGGPNGCLAGHSCADGACRQTVSLGAYGPSACALLSDGSVRCWGLWGLCDVPCYMPAEAFGGRRFTTMDASGRFVLDASGAAFDLNDPDRALRSPPGSVVGAGCVARVADGLLDCGSRTRPGPTGIVQIGYDALRTAAGELWSLDPRPVRLIDAGVVAMDAEGTCVVMADGTGRCRVPPATTHEPVVGVAGATEVAFGAGTAWFLRGADEGLVVPYGGAPEPLLGSAGMHGIVAGDLYACAIAGDGRVVCWVRPERPDPWYPLGLPRDWPDPPNSRTIGGL